MSSEKNLADINVYECYIEKIEHREGQGDCLPCDVIDCAKCECGGIRFIRTDPFVFTCKYCNKKHMFSDLQEPGFTYRVTPESSAETPHPRWKPIPPR